MKNTLKQLRKRWHNDLFDTLHQLYNMPYIKNMQSYYANQALLNQGTAAMTADYQYYHALHRLLHVRDIDRTAYRLVRLGKAYDGGYVVAEKQDSHLLSDTRIAYSLGICDDVSFDLFQYDHTIDGLPMQCKRFHWRKLGITGGQETAQLKTLETLLKRDGNDNRTGMVLKCDIEGAEWDMLANCSDALLMRFDQIIIEFHDLLRFDQRSLVLHALKKLRKTHQAIHVHLNNNGSVNYSDKLITPDYLEVTFVLKSKIRTLETDLIFPAAEDQPCNPELIDIPLGRWNVQNLQ